MQFYPQILGLIDTLNDWNDKTNGVESNLILKDLEKIEKVRLDCQCYPGIVNKGKYVTLVKYTSLPTLMDMMKFGTMRIFSVVGMNDKSELDFVDDYLYDGKKVFADDSDGIGLVGIDTLFPPLASS